MDMLTLKAYAKINLGLDVIRRREDGYHEIRTIMQTIDLHDTLRFEASTHTEISIDRDDLSCGEDNIIFRCIKEIQRYTKLPDAGLRVRLEKKIPMQAGLGGGSADGAAALIAYNYIYRTNLSSFELAEIGGHVGADIPFLITGGSALCEGIGEIVTPIQGISDYIAVILKPECSINTAQAYAFLDQIEIQQRPSFDPLIEALRTKNSSMIQKNNINVFEEYAFRQFDTLRNLKERMAETNPISVSMSGSGSAFCALFRHKDEAHRAVEDLRRNYREIYLCKFKNQSVVIV